LQWCEDERFPTERDLQKIFEDNLQEMLHIDFLASEFPTGPNHRGRIDTLGLDEMDRPVVIEYKRNRDENVINQGLDYLHWMEGQHARARIRTLVQQKLGDRNIDFEEAWLLCVAWQFPRRDVVAARYSEKLVALLKYACFGDGIIAIELIHPDPEEDALIDETNYDDDNQPDFSKTSGWRGASVELRTLFIELHDLVLGLGPDVQVEPRSQLVTFKGNFNIVAVNLRSRENCLLAYVSVDPAKMKLERGFTRDTQGYPLNHNRVEITIRNRKDLERARPLLRQAYEHDARGERFRWVE